MSLQLEIYRGDDREWALYFSTAQPYSVENAIDITDWTIFFTVKNSSNDPDASAIIKKDITVHTAPLVGKSSLSLIAADTDSQIPKLYYCDIQVKNAANKIRTLDTGTLEIHTDITRRVV